jgi:threonyl-tRNA synthetase
MRILQLDVDNITYELVKPESRVHEEGGEKRVSVDDALALLVSVEKGDDAGTAKEAMRDVSAFMEKQKRKRLMIYPFAHLSTDLSSPEEAQAVLNDMAAEAPKGVEVSKAPFGWNKKLSISVKGHPLAEQSRRYGKVSGGEPKVPHAKAKPAISTAIVKKSDWSGLPDTDHRTIGEGLDLYSFQEVSPGMTYWHPNGYIIYKELFKYIREMLEKYGYLEIATPAFANIALWHVSGHDEHYKDNMFLFDVDGQEYGLKPMNCPSTFLVFKSKKWSYREFPVRFADFDKLYRNEISGALTGLFRVRELTQDDAHLFVREDQVESELTMVLKMVEELYRKFDLTYKAKLSTMPDDHAGEKEAWDMATAKLAQVLKTNKVDYELKEKEGAFYGPKIDFDVKDSLGREWQCATIQLDYQLPKRFNLSYTGEDGAQHTPVVIHRVIYGTLERFIGVMTEHFQGKFPAWLAPVQVKVISISEQTSGYAQKVYDELKASGLRAELDIGDRSMAYKLREAIGEKVPYVVILGQKEEDAKKITVRSRSGAQRQGMALESFLKDIGKEVSDRNAKAHF